MKLDYLLIDVFTDRPFGGSRLYLFPDGSEVPADLMQNLAMELGAGETAFVVPVSSSSSASGIGSGLRVFTPSAEIPFGGHSVLGATFALDHMGRRDPGHESAPYVWELESGQYSVVTDNENGNRIYSLRLDPPVFMGQYFHLAIVVLTPA